MPESQQDAAGTDTRILQTRCTIRRQNFQTASRVRASVGNTFLTADETPQTAHPHPTATQIRNHAHTPAFKPFPRFSVGRRLDSLAVFRRHALAGRAFACAPGAGRHAVVRRCGALCFRAAGCVAGGGGGVSAAESGGRKPPLGGSGRGGVVERRARHCRRPLAVRRGGGAGVRAGGSVGMAA